MEEDEILLILSILEDSKLRQVIEKTKKAGHDPVVILEDFLKKNERV